MSCVVGRGRGCGRLVVVVGRGDVGRGSWVVVVGRQLSTRWSVDEAVGRGSWVVGRGVMGRRGSWVVVSVVVVWSWSWVVGTWVVGRG